MRNRVFIVFAFSLIASASPAGPRGRVFSVPQSTAGAPASGPAGVTATMDDAVADYRKIIVLMDGANALDEGNRERVRTVAWILFERNRDRLAKLESDLS